jgi:hypothetical protein
MINDSCDTTIKLISAGTRIYIRPWFNFGTHPYFNSIKLHKKIKKEVDLHDDRKRAWRWAYFG